MGRYLARDAFNRDAHEKLHELIRVTQGRNVVVSERLQDAKLALEESLGFLFQGRDPTQAFTDLLSALSDAYRVTGVAVPETC